jgi:DNA recombination protein RmuC
VLGEAKAEFGKYGGVLDKLKKQLDAAANTVDDAGVRTRAIERKLKDVQSIELPAAPRLTAIAGGRGDAVEDQDDASGE